MTGAVTDATEAFLAMTARPEVGRCLLEPHPAFVVASDGRRLLWCNAAAVRLFEATDAWTLLDQRFSGLNPFVAQAARLARTLPSESSRLQMLRIGRGTRLATVAAACRRLNLDDGERAVLAIAAAGGASSSLATRAEDAAQALAIRHGLVSFLDEDGRVLAAVGAAKDLEPAEQQIDDLITQAGAGADNLVTSELVVGSTARQAAVARLAKASVDGSGSVYLVLVGPPEAAKPSPAAVDAESEAPAVDATPAERPPTIQDNVPPAAEPAPAAADTESAHAPRRTSRFVWGTDADDRIVTVTSQLAAAVGDGNAALVGRGWDEVADALGLTLPAERAQAWTARVIWPVSDTATAVAIDLFALAPEVGGRRGFGIIHHDEIEPALPGAGLAAHDAPDAPMAEPDEAFLEPEEASLEPVDLSDPDDAARLSVEAGHPSTPAMDAPPTAVAEPLSGHEREAFRKIGESLTPTSAAEAETIAPASPVPPDTGTVADDHATAEALLDRVPLGLMVIRDGDTLFANRALTDLLGYAGLDDLSEAGGIDAVFPDNERYLTARDLTGEAGRVFAALRDGGTVAVTVSMRTVTWDGANALMVALSPDAADADREGLTTDLAAAVARAGELEAVLDTATDGVAVVDRAGRVLNLNRAAEALFGVESAEMIGRPLTDLLAQESRRTAVDYLEGLATNGVASVLNDGREVIGKVPSGGLIPLFMTMGRIGDADTYCAVLRDITYWKNVEEELVAAKHDAEEANKQKSEFLAKVSHEIRTPLNAIIGFSEVMIEERFGPVENERYRSYLRDIHTSGDHLMSLINDLLDLSKIEAGKMDLNFESVPMNAVIQECVALMQPQANRERIIIRTSLSTAVPNVVADQRSMRQVLLNLLSNAVKFTAAGGQVIVSTGLEDNGEVAVRVRDTGVGMSEKDLRSALQPFRQLATTKRDADKGTGLGLPLTKALVEANRATFDIESAPDQGTMVRITFPTTRVLAG